MIANQEGPLGGEPWRVRVRSACGLILGAGVLLDRDHVLTCAHVAMAADELAVDMVGLAGIPSSAAHIVDGLCVPPDGERGDVAVLKLGEPQPDGIGAVLRRAALTWDRPVHTLGYPHDNGLDIGVWARMTLAGRAGVEWLQMNRRSGTEQRVRAGFSGSGVADDATGDVLGIVVSEYTDDAAGLSWMLPVEAIVGHLPLVSEWAVGGSRVDPIFEARPGDRVGRVAELADWLGRRDDGAAVLIVVGPDLAAVRKAVALSSAATVADVGVDLALDVSGRTVEEVSRRIVDRAGLAVPGTSSERVRAGTPPMTIVVDGVDEAEQPQALVGDVLKPLVDSGARLVLGFRHDDSASLSAARALAEATVTTRLDGLAARIGAVNGERGVRLRLRLSALRRAAVQDSALVAGRLADFDRAVARAERGQRRADLTADDRGLLQAWKAKAAQGGLVEHLELAAAYRAAHDLLTAEPVDRAAAHAAVRAYQDAVRQALRKERR